jgi:hypothetical protein
MRRTGGCDGDRAFEQFAFVEYRAGTDEGDQVRGVDRPPTGLGDVDELVGHGNSRALCAGTLVTFVRNRTVADAAGR